VAETDDFVKGRIIGKAAGACKPPLAWQLSRAREVFKAKFQVSQLARNLFLS